MDGDARATLNVDTIRVWAIFRSLNVHLASMKVIALQHPDMEKLWIYRVHTVDVVSFKLTNITG